MRSTSKRPPARRALGLFAASILALATVKCSSFGNDTEANAPSSDGATNPADGAAVTEGGEPILDAAPGASDGGGGGTTKTFSCSAQTMERCVAGSQQCCKDYVGAGPSHCVPLGKACDTTEGTFACKDEDDCAAQGLPGQICCGKIVGTRYVTISCLSAAECAAALGDRLCATAAVCDAGQSCKESYSGEDSVGHRLCQ